MRDEDVEAQLRTAAVAFGIDPDAAVREMRHGGPLAQIFRMSLGAERKKRGRPSEDERNWRWFCMVVMQKRTQTKRGQGDRYERSAHLAAAGSGSHDPGLPDKMKTNYAKMKKAGYRDEHVPPGLAALFSATPPIIEE